jgi:PAS domain-containing protein
VLACVLSALTLAFFFLPPLYSLHVDDAMDVRRLGIFVVAALAIIWLGPRKRPPRLEDPSASEDSVRALESVRRAQAELTALMASLDDRAVFRLDERGRITGWGQGAEQVTRLRGEDVLGRHLSCLYPTETRPEGVAAKDLQTAATEERMRGERWIMRGDQSRFRAEVIITAQREPSRHQPCQFLVVARPMPEPGPSGVQG